MFHEVRPNFISPNSARDSGVPEAMVYQGQENTGYLDKKTARIIDELVDSWTIAYIASVRRLMGVYNRVPPDDVVSREMSWYHYPIDFSEEHLPLSSDDVYSWRQRRDAIEETLMPLVSRLAKMTVHTKIYGYTETEAEAWAYYTLHRVVTFSYHWGSGAADGIKSDGNRIQILLINTIPKSLLDMAYHEGSGEMPYCDLENPDSGSSIIEQIPDPDSSKGYIPDYPSIPWGETLPRTLPDPIRKDPKKIVSSFALPQIFGLIQSMPLPEQFLLLYRFGYIHPGKNREEITNLVGYNPSSVSIVYDKFLHHIEISKGSCPQPQGSLWQMFDQLHDLEMIKAERYRQHRSLLLRVVSIPKQEVAGLQSEYQEIMGVIADSCTYTPNGRISENLTAVAEGLSSNYGRKYSVSMTKNFLRQILHSLGRYDKPERVRRQQDTTYCGRPTTDKGTIPSFTQTYTLTPRQREVMKIVESDPYASFEEIGRQLGITRQRAHQLVTAVSSKKIKVVY